MLLLLENRNSNCIGKELAKAEIGMFYPYCCQFDLSWSLREISRLIPNLLSTCRQTGGKMDFNLLNHCCTSIEELSTSIKGEGGVTEIGYSGVRKNVYNSYTILHREKERRIFSFLKSILGMSYTIHRNCSG